MSDYISIPLHVAPSVTHTIFIRRQLYGGGNQGESDSDSDANTDNIVFATNLPLDTTEDNIKDMCKALGDVVLDEYIYQGSRHGLIKLIDESAADRFLGKARKLAKKGKVSWEQYGPRGADGYLARHYAKFPEEADLQEKVDEYMTLFAEREERDAEEFSRAAEEVDSEGFRLVTYNKRKRPGAPAVMEEPPKKKKTLEKSDFYRFQLRQQRKQEMSDLLTRFQQDKQKVEEMKQKKHFKPY